MKKVTYLIAILAITYGCSSFSSFKTHPVQKKENILLTKDSVEYELLIIDSGFESWFAARNTIATVHSDIYYQNWNRIYVVEWNQLYMQGRPFIENYIEYDPAENYGLEINYKLYYYFQFVEEKNRISIINR
ncbi:hypothetical protein BZG02_10290 [Labilibaculum filiforme]|uniref:Lipoprotein n=1 Tax=Labilibaculum filiforme TaxID=1940526 RepID=A0A2N3HYL4_9BACT|nr:DUF6146 family protein [Labilibaculum filiforme]PKQ63142.1 hypothetical protein BZG02_10290 [Labilibaculum filiforme]